MAHLKKNYIIAEFDDKSVELLASKWVRTLITGKQYCLWPPYSKKKMADALKNLHEVEKNWAKYDIARIFTSTNDYTKGVAIAIQATDESTFDEQSPNEDDQEDSSPSVRESTKKIQNHSGAVDNSTSAGQQSSGKNDTNLSQKSNADQRSTELLQANSKPIPANQSAGKSTNLQEKSTGPTEANSKPIPANQSAGHGNSNLGKSTSIQKKSTGPTEANSKPIPANQSAGHGNSNLGKSTNIQKKSTGSTKANTGTMNSTNLGEQTEDQVSENSSSSSDESDSNNVTIENNDPLTIHYQMLLRINRKQNELVKSMNKMKVEFEEVKQCLMLHKPVKATALMDKFSKTFGNVLPLADEESLQTMEKALEKPENLKLLNEWMLLTCGGTTLKEYISDVMKKILANDLALEYSGQGRRNVKKNFSLLRLYDSLTCACLDKFPSCGGSKEITPVVSQFLVGARDRGEARVARIAKAANNKAAAMRENN